MLTTLEGNWGWLPQDDALWSADGKQLLLYELDPPKGRQARVALLSREGAMVAETTLPIHVAVLAILPGDQLLVSGRRKLLIESLALQPGASPRYPASLLPAKIEPSAIIYVPQP